MKKCVKITLLSVGIPVLAFILIVVSYLLYVVCSYSRIADSLALSVANNRETVADGAGEYTVMTYNVGFGAYSPDYTFFMDTGVMRDGTKTTGKYGKAISADDVRKNTDGSVGVIQKYSPDFAIIQEVDYDSSRSYKVDQRAAFTGIDGYGSVFAENYHSSYLMYPFGDPHGKNNAGIVTLSKYKVEDSVRRSFPISGGFSKFTDLDRCFSVTHIPVGDKTLSLISLHMSAYDKGGVIRKKQAEMLKGVLQEEYDKGYYVIAGGDFNQDLIGNLEKFASEQQIPEWVATYDENDLPQGFSIATDFHSTVGSCRGADVVWKRDWTYTCVIDGFIVSDNIAVKKAEIIDNDFAFSDHNPVLLTFEFNAN